MKRLTSFVVVALAAVATFACLSLPAWMAATIAVAAFALRRRGRLGLLGFAAATLAFDAALFGFLVGNGDALHLGWLAFYPQAAATGIVAATRLIAAVTANLALFDHASATIVLDGFRLPPRLAGFLAAIVLGTHAVSEDARRLALAQKLEGGPTRRRRWRAAGTTLPALFISGMRRAQVRRDALRLAGHDMGKSFAPVVAIAALAAAGRLAFAAVPNVSPTYAIVFLGGVLFGPWVGAWAGAVAMAMTDLLLSGLLPMPYVNVPAMAILGALGGMVRRFDWEGRGAADQWAVRLLAGVTGYAATLLFSVASDLFTWALIPETRGSVGTLQAYVVAGLAFNLIPAAANAVLFAVGTPATVRAWRLVNAAAPQRGKKSVV